ncbi:hypothetical protein EfmE1039_0116 [Enterococcus faecium E1039]|nr:hypothetical protein EfmE1039_0116 [Enterococcus faecium E1039]
MLQNLRFSFKNKKIEKRLLCLYNKAFMVLYQKNICLNVTNIK